MANPPRMRKRVFGLLRAPDGSAFIKCDYCCVSVPVALHDMHKCKVGEWNKILKGGDRSVSVEEGDKILTGGERNVNVESGHERFKDKDWYDQTSGHERFCNQPRSAFRLFMESFKNAHKDKDWRDVEQRGFETWKYMWVEERHRFVVEAEKVNLAYEKALLEEIDNFSEVDDEADSAIVGKFDRKYECWDSSETTGSSTLKRFKTLDSSYWGSMGVWL